MVMMSMMIMMMTMMMTMMDKGHEVMNSKSTGLGGDGPK